MTSDPRLQLAPWPWDKGQDSAPRIPLDAVRTPCNDARARIEGGNRPHVRFRFPFAGSRPRCLRSSHDESAGFDPANGQRRSV